MSTLLRSLGAVALASLLVACGGADSADDEESVSEAEAALTANDKVAFDYFLGKGLSPEQAAGIIGNLDQESGMNPKIKQYGGGPGRGIAQWSAGGRWDKSKNDNAVGYAAKHNVDVYALKTQLDFIWYELNTFPGYGLAPLKKAKDVTTAMRVFMKEYEICGTCADGKRLTYAKAALKAYGNDVVKPPAPPAPATPKPDAGATPTTPTTPTTPPPTKDAGTTPSTTDAGPIATADAGADPDPTDTTPSTDDEPYTDPVETDPADDDATQTTYAHGARSSLGDGTSASGCSATPLGADDVGAGFAALVFATSVFVRRRRRA